MVLLAQAKMNQASFMIYLKRLQRNSVGKKLSLSTLIDFFWFSSQASNKVINICVATFLLVSGL
jgi:hypothetical protein